MVEAGFNIVSYKYRVLIKAIQDVSGFPEERGRGGSVARLGAVVQLDV